MTFEIGSTSASVDIGVSNDEINEEVETFTATLTLPVSFNGVTLGANTEATVTVTDDDGKPLCIDYFSILVKFSLLCDINKDQRYKLTIFFCAKGAGAMAERAINYAITTSFYYVNRLKFSHTSFSSLLII